MSTSNAVTTSGAASTPVFALQQTTPLPPTRRRVKRKTWQTVVWAAVLIALTAIVLYLYVGQCLSKKRTAAALAEGVRDRCSATWGVGLTGVAGPDPVDGHRPGRVYVGVAGGGRADVRRLDLGGDRAEVRAAAVDAAMDALLSILSGQP